MNLNIMLTYNLLASVTYEGNRILLLFKSKKKKKNYQIEKTFGC